MGSVKFIGTNYDQGGADAFFEFTYNDSHKPKNVDAGPYKFSGEWETSDQNPSEFVVNGMCPYGTDGMFTDIILEPGLPFHTDSSLMYACCKLVHHHYIGTPMPE